jgi:hypothetical protein
VIGFRIIIESDLGSSRESVRTGDNESELTHANVRDRWIPAGGSTMATGDELHRARSSGSRSLVGFWIWILMTMRALRAHARSEAYLRQCLKVDWQHEHGKLEQIPQKWIFLL